MSEEFGSGIYLDEVLDFEIDPTGDIKSIGGTSELQKDLSVQMIYELDQYTGAPPKSNIDEKIADAVITLAELDPRVESVYSDSISVSFSDDREQISVNVSLQTIDGEQNLVFDV